MGFSNSDLEKAKSKGMAKSYITAFIGLLLMNFVLAHFVDYTESTTAILGAQTGFWIWLGFIIPVLLGSILWEGKPFELYLINMLYWLIGLVVGGGIFGVWG